MFGWLSFLAFLSQFLAMAQNPCGTTADGSDLCPAAAMNAITAAFATQGYWAQADVLYYLSLTDLGLWAPLLYVCAAIGALVGVATGAPPRNYMWFIIGPVIYSWLIDTRQPVLGVRWMVGYSQMSQWEVWRLAEPGLRNMNIIQRFRVEGGRTDEEYANRVPGAALSGGTSVSVTFDPVTNKPTVTPAEALRVSSAFLWWDELVTSTVQFIVDWAGVNRQCSLDASTSTLDCKTFGSGSGTGSTIDGNGNWFLISARKWEILANITGATFANPMLRDAFNEYIASECGDELMKQFDLTKYAQVAKSRGRELTGEIDTLFHKSPFGETLDEAVRKVRTNLSNQGLTMTVSPRFKAFLNGAAIKVSTRTDQYNPEEWVSSDRQNLGDFACNIRNDSESNTFGNLGDTLNCGTATWLIVQALRLDASLIYAKVIQSLPHAPITIVNQSSSSLTSFKQSPELLPYFLFYGWDLRSEGAAPGETGDVLTGPQMSQFLKDLILVYLFRNEMRATPIRVSQRLAASAEVQNYVDRAVREPASYNKYGELYSWALMVPYVQGLILYYLAMGFPFACLLVIVPGWHKALFTWMSFWAWAKLWDVGFALVNTTERSIWAMMGGNSDTTRIHQMIVGMSKFGQTDVSCPPSTGMPAGALLCNSPHVKQAFGGTAGLPSIGEQYTCSGPGISGEYASTAAQTIEDALKTFDRLMMLQTNVDLDLVTGYYIFIMSALYLAVPAVVGQLVLGAKAGVANMLTSGISGAAGEVGKAASSGYADRLSNRMNQAGAVQDQTAAAKEMRRGGLAGQAIAAQNEALNYGTAASAIGTLGQNIGRAASVREGAARMEQQRIGQVATTNKATADQVAAGFGMAAAGTGMVVSGVGGLQALGGGRAVGAPSGRTTSAPGSEGVASTGTTGAATTGAGDNQPSFGKSAADFMNSLASGANSAARAYNAQVDKNAAAANFWSAARNYADQSRMTAQQADAGIAGFNLGAQQQGAQMSGRRLEEAAGFGAQSAVWDRKRARAEAVSGEAAASGLMSGSFNAGDLPVSQAGFAWNGMLGSGASNAMRYTVGGSNSAFGQSVAATTSQLSASVGGQAILNGQFNIPSYSEGSTMLSQANQYAGSGMTGSQAGTVNPNQIYGGLTRSPGTPAGESNRDFAGMAPSFTGNLGAIGSNFGTGPGVSSSLGANQHVGQLPDPKSSAEGAVPIAQPASPALPGALSYLAPSVSEAQQMFQGSFREGAPASTRAEDQNITRSGS